jgi:hypothetical protein
MNFYDGLSAGDIDYLRAQGLEATQRAVCPSCKGKVLVWTGTWHPCEVCAGHGWVLVRSWLERAPEDDHYVDGGEAYVERREYLFDERRESRGQR